MNTFGRDIVFVDTEFSSLDPYVGEILSVGLVKPSGEELYLELKHDGEVSEWVREHILPTLNDHKVSRDEAKKLIWEFIGDQKPYLVACVGQFDTIYLYKLFGTGNTPFYWLPIDFASILFALGRNPESLNESFCKELGIDYKAYRTHHALDDARLVRDVYKKVLQISKQPVVS